MKIEDLPGDHLCLCEHRKDYHHGLGRMPCGKCECLVFQPMTLEEIAAFEVTRAQPSVRLLL